MEREKLSDPLNTLDRLMDKALETLVRSLEAAKEEEKSSTKNKFLKTVNLINEVSGKMLETEEKI